MIVFVIGGATYSEIRSAYEIADTYNRDVFIGTTEILRPTKFIEELGSLRLPVPAPMSVIAPYVPPPPPQKQQDSGVSKTASLMSHMHINTSSSVLSNKSSSMSLDKLSATSDDSSKEKKKKKGLGRFFG